MGECKDDDTEMVKRAQGGDSRAFEALVTKHYTTIFKMAFKWCGGRRQDAEDITQESCIRLSRALDGFRFECAFTSWLYTITISTGKDWVRKNNRVPANAAESGLAAEAQSPTSRQDETLYARQILGKVAALPDGEKEALLLVVAEGLTHAQAARLCGVKESTISWRIHEARKKLGVAA